MASDFAKRLKNARSAWEAAEASTEDVNSEEARELQEATDALYATAPPRPRDAVGLIDHVLGTEDIEGWAIAVLKSLRSAAVEWDQSKITAPAA